MCVLGLIQLKIPKLGQQYRYGCTRAKGSDHRVQLKMHQGHNGLRPPFVDFYVFFIFYQRFKCNTFAAEFGLLDNCKFLRVNPSVSCSYSNPSIRSATRSHTHTHTHTDAHTLSHRHTQNMPKKVVKCGFVHVSMLKNGSCSSVSGIMSVGRKI